MEAYVIYSTALALRGKIWWLELPAFIILEMSTEDLRSWSMMLDLICISTNISLLCDMDP